jgi:hypothetical protein
MPGNRCPKAPVGRPECGRKTFTTDTTPLHGLCAGILEWKISQLTYYTHEIGPLRYDIEGPGKSLGRDTRRTANKPNHPFQGGWICQCGDRAKTVGDMVADLPPSEARLRSAFLSGAAIDRFTSLALPSSPRGTLNDPCLTQMTQRVRGSRIRMRLFSS